MQEGRKEYAGQAFEVARLNPKAIKRDTGKHQINEKNGPHNCDENQCLSRENSVKHH